MKKLYFLLTMILVVTMAWSQTTRTWVPSSGGSWNTGTNWNPVGIPAANDLVVFNTGFSGIVNNVPASITLGRLTVTNNTNLTLQATAVRTLTMAAGTGTDLVIDAGSALTMGTNINITLANNATATIDGTLTVNTGRTYDGNQTGNVTTVNGTIQNSGSIHGTITALLFQSGSTYIHTQNGGSIPIGGWDVASTCQVTGVSVSVPAQLDQAFGNFTWNCAGQTGDITTGTELETINGDFTVTNTNNEVFRASSGSTVTLTIGGDFIINGASALYVIQNGNGNTKTCDVAGDFNMTAGTLRMTSAGSNGTSVFNVAGDFSHTGGTITELGSGTSTIVFDGTGVQDYTSGGTNSNAINYTVNSGAAINFGTSVLSGSTGTFTLSAGAKIVTSNANGLSATGSVQITRSYNSGADYEFRGASTGTFTTTTNPQVRDLTVNNSSGAVTLAQPMTVDRNFVLTDGLLTTTSTNLLTINTAGTSTAATATSFVDGPMAKVGTAAFTFPVGKSGQGYRNIGITAPALSSTFQAEFFKADPPAGTLGSGLTHKSTCEYWELGRTAGTGSAQVTLSWESNSSCNGASYVTDLSTLRVAHLVGGTWVDEGNQATSGNTSSGSITSNLISTFSPFTLASSAGSQNPLPVMFANVRAYEKNSGIQIEWSNLTERDIVNYTVERSADGRNYTTLSQQLPKRNLNDKADYTEFDAAPANGANFYRVKVLEIGGKIIYSKVLRVEKGNVKQSFSMYPNPVAGNDVTVSLAGVKQGQYKVRVVNGAGQDVFQKVLAVQGSGITQTLELPAVKPGVYTMVINGDGYMESKLFIVQ
jgi:hypothetical protein